MNNTIQQHPDTINPDESGFPPQTQRTSLPRSNNQQSLSHPCRVDLAIKDFSTVYLR